MADRAAQLKAYHALRPALAARVLPEPRPPLPPRRPPVTRQTIAKKRPPMGTKTKPGPYDCYAIAATDEPLFTLIARDPLAPFLVSIWSSLRYCDGQAARAKFEALLSRANRYAIAPDVAKAQEAIDCAMAMFAWRRAKGLDPAEDRETVVVDA